MHFQIAVTSEYVVGFGFVPFSEIVSMLGSMLKLINSHTHTFDRSLPERESKSVRF